MSIFFKVGVKPPVVWQTKATRGEIRFLLAAYLLGCRWQKMMCLTRLRLSAWILKHRLHRLKWPRQEEACFAFDVWVKHRAVCFWRNHLKAWLNKKNGFIQVDIISKCGVVTQGCSFCASSCHHKVIENFFLFFFSLYLCFKLNVLKPTVTTCWVFAEPCCLFL